MGLELLEINCTCDSLTGDLCITLGVALLQDLFFLKTPFCCSVSILSLILMARLDAVMAETKENLVLEKKKLLQKTRLVADPYIQVGQIQNVLEQYMTYMKSNDLWALISPPASLAMVNWQTPPCADWLAKCSNLLFDILEFAPNTKLQGTKVSKAINGIYLSKNLELRRDIKVQDAIDNISLSLRIVLSMLRTVKINDNMRSKVMRSLANQDAMKLQLVLKKVVLPEECFEANGQEFAAEDTAEQLDVQPCVALVPKEVLGQTPVVTHSKAPLLTLSVSLRPMPDIFNKILKNENLQHQQPVRDEDLLVTAMSTVPQPVKEQTKAKSKKKQPKQNKVKQVMKAKKAKTIKKTKAEKKVKQSQDIQEQKAEKTKAEKKVKQSKEHAEEDAVPTQPPKIPEYEVDVFPTAKDSYRNLYVSRHHNKAKALALRWGLSLETAKEKGRKAGATASAIWDMHHGQVFDAE